MLLRRQTAKQLRVIGIGGSLRENSTAYLALEHAMTLLRGLGCSTQIIDLRKTILPFCNGDGSELWPEYPGVAEMRASVSRAHAFVLSTPEYHGSISGVLKNALDLLGEEQLNGKVAAVISVLGGPANGNALNDLSRVVRACHAWVMPQYIAIGHAHTAFENGVIRDKALAHRFVEFAHSLVESATRICDFDEAETEREYQHEKHKSHSRTRSGARNRVLCRCATNRKRASVVIECPLVPSVASGEVKSPEIRG
jgi:FMN reductase